MLLVKDLVLLNGSKVSLTLEEGGEYVLRGSNGSGKTLLLRTLAGLYSGMASEFSWKGKSFAEYSPEDFRTRVLYVSPTTAMTPEMTAEEFLNAPLKLSTYQNYPADKTHHNLLREWGISGKTLGHLSSGQKQLLGIIRAISLKAEVLLLDEPTSHMDHEKTLIVEKLLKDWQAKSPERILLIVTHSEEQAQRFRTKISFSDLTSP